MMKKIVYIIGVVFVLSSCSFLDTEVYGNLDEKNLYHDETSCMAGLAGVYDRLGTDGVYGLNLWGELDAGTDLTVYRADYNKSKALPSLNNYNNTDTYLQLTWQNLYEALTVPMITLLPLPIVRIQIVAVRKRKRCFWQKPKHYGHYST